MQKTRNKFQFVMTVNGLICYDKETPMTVRLDQKETNEITGKKINYSKYDEHCEVAHLEVSNTCFPAGTSIDVPFGKVPIEVLQKGDECYIYNNGYRQGKIERTFKRKYKGDLIEIELEDNVKLRLTPNHKVYTTNRGWIKASELNIKDELADMQNLRGEISE